MITANIPFLNDYFVDKNVIHRTCESKAIKFPYMLPFSIRKDFDKTKCGLPVDDMEWYPSGTLFAKPGLTFCENCIN